MSGGIQFHVLATKTLQFSFLPSKRWSGRQKLKKNQIRMREDISQNRQRWPLSPFFFSFLFFPRFPFFLFLLADLRKQRHGSPISSRKPIVWNSKRDANFISFPHIFFQFPTLKMFEDWIFCYMHWRDGQIPLGEISQVPFDSLNCYAPILRRKHKQTYSVLLPGTVEFNSAAILRKASLEHWTNL